MKNVVLSVSMLLALLGTELRAEVKVAKDVAYGPHQRNVLDVYWKSNFKNAPIVFTIHGGGFRNGSKAYCNAAMQKLYLDKGCVVVSPNYRLIGDGKPTKIADCEIDCAMAVAYIQANAAKYGGDPARILSTGSSAGGYLSARIAYRKSWDWPAGAKHKPKKLNIVGWYGDSPFLPSYAIKSVAAKDPPGFIIYGEHEHRATPASQGHDMRAALKAKGVWNAMVYVAGARHVPGRRALIVPQTRNKAAYTAYDRFLDMVLFSKAPPEDGTLIKIGR